ncbi:MAG: DUF1573 domain-containing protein [Bacteroidota bacterium]
MKRLVFITFALLTFVMAGINAQDNNDTVIISFDKEVYDYGVVERGSDGSCEFNFTNEGKKPLILSSVSSSCGCTVPEWPRTPVAPGETAKISVRYDTKRVGAFTKTVTVRSNASTPTKILRIKGEVTAN